jgi:hypothetical protein
MKSKRELWKEYDETHDLCKQSIKDLSWHIENDDYSGGFVDMATQLILDTKSYAMRTILIPSIAKNLEHKDEDIRAYAISYLLGQMALDEYGNKVFDMALHDPSDYVKERALGHLGIVINKVDKEIAQKMAWSMYEVLINEDLEKYGKSYRDGASDSVLEAMGYNYHAFGRAWNDPDFDPIWKDFVKKYKLEYKPVFRR